MCEIRPSRSGGRTAAEVRTVGADAPVTGEVTAWSPRS
jgi:hypothetical protein